jgi:hypothetical protein
MSLTLDTTLVDVANWDAEVPTVEDWLRTMWGIRAGASSPRSSGLRVHPSCLASAGWLNALWGFSV